jgi:PKD repeat protein
MKRQIEMGVYKRLVPRYTLLMACVLCIYSGSAQLEFSRWFFGFNTGLDFNTSPPTVLTNGGMISAEGCASISDSNGNLLFYTNGVDVFNNTHSMMANGTGLMANLSSAQGATIVKQPGNTNLYYIFTTQGAGVNSLKYSIVDMSLAAGLGSVTTKNVNLPIPIGSERLVAARHCNGRDVWIITREHNTNNFLSFLLSSSGVNTTAIISSVGEISTGTSGSAIGQLKISPDGRKLAMSTWSASVPSSSGGGGYFLFDFDASSGVVSNSLILLSTSPGAYGIEFSPDGTKLYGTRNGGPSGTPNFLDQWNICAPTLSAIVSSHYSVSLTNIVGSIQRAIDGKLYFTTSQQSSISVIHNPNASGAAMSLAYHSISIAPKNGALGLPNYINTWTKPAPSPFTSTIACLTTSFTVPPIPTFSSGCSNTPYPPSGYLWDFGEPASGTANTSTLSNPVHSYSATGTYTVKLVLQSNCTNDTVIQAVNITAPGPAVSVSGPSVICKGEKRTYTAGGAQSYKWSNNVTTSTVALSPTVTTVYSVSGTEAGCTNTKTFTVMVNECPGFAGSAEDARFSFYPNPTHDKINIYTEISLDIRIIDLKGAEVFKGSAERGTTELDVRSLMPGLYILEATSAGGSEHRRLVKVTE